MAGKVTKDRLHSIKGKAHTIYFGLSPGFNDGGMLIQPPASVSEPTLRDIESDAGVRNFAEEARSTFGTSFYFDIEGRSSLEDAIESVRVAAKLLLEVVERTVDIEAFKHYCLIEGEEN